MARPLRIEFPGALYHITSRGNRRAQVFTCDGDRTMFLNKVAEVNRRYETICHAYCLMDNHYHLLLETPRGNISSAMRQLNGVYTQAFNWVHNKVGHVFQGRYTSVLIEKDAHLLEAARYVVLNPVRAGLVCRPEEWLWSSYRASIGLEKAEECLTTVWLLTQFGDRQGKATGKYKQFVMEAPDIQLGEELHTAIVFGNAEFASRCGLQAPGRASVTEIPRKQRFLARPDLASILNQVGGKAERIAAAVETYGYTQKAVADTLGIHYSAVSKLLSRQMSRFKT